MKKLKYYLIFILAFSSIGFALPSEAKTWDITEDMMQEMEKGIPALKAEFLEKMPCADKVSIYRHNKEKGLVFDAVLKNSACVEEIDWFTNKQSAINGIKNKPEWNGLIPWFQRGFYFKYIYKSYSGKKLSETILDRNTLFWTQFSVIEDPQASKGTIKISTEGKTLSFTAKGFGINDLVIPGHPSIGKYCDIDFKQERYFLSDEAILLTVSIVKLSIYWPDEQQLQCINNGDFDIQKKLLKPTDMAQQFTNHNSIKSLLKPVYKITENKSIIAAFSGLIDKNKAIYFLFTIPNSENHQKIIENIVASASVM